MALRWFPDQRYKGKLPTEQGKPLYLSSRANEQIISRAVPRGKKGSRLATKYSRVETNSRNLKIRLLVGDSGKLATFFPLARPDSFSQKSRERAAAPRDSQIFDGNLGTNFKFLSEPCIPIGSDIERDAGQITKLDSWETVPRSSRKDKRLEKSFRALSNALTRERLSVLDRYYGNCGTEPVNDTLMRILGLSQVKSSLEQSCILNSVSLTS